MRGCASQVWLVTEATEAPGRAAVLHFRGDSDAHIVRGLIAILFAIYPAARRGDRGEPMRIAVFAKLGLKEHLTPQRSNGFVSMVERIRSDARAIAAAA